MFSLKILAMNDRLILEQGGDWVSVPILTNTEARRLLDMTKRSLIAELDFPTRVLTRGNEKEFDVVGDTKKDIFTIKIYRGKIQRLKYNIGARIKKNGILLLELHINPSGVHANPDGEKIRGSHWHVYTEKYGRSYAFPAENIQEDAFIDNTITFLTKFNVVEQPNITYQLELL